MDFLIDLLEGLQAALYEGVVQPIAVAAGQSQLLEKAYEGTGCLVAGLLQLVVILVVIGPMQRRWRRLLIGLPEPSGLDWV